MGSEISNVRQVSRTKGDYKPAVQPGFFTSLCLDLCLLYKRRTGKTAVAVRAAASPRTSTKRKPHTSKDERGKKTLLHQDLVRFLES